MHWPSACESHNYVPALLSPFLACVASYLPFLGYTNVFGELSRQYQWKTGKPRLTFGREAMIREESILFLHCLITVSLKVHQLGKLAGPVVGILVLRRTISSIISLVTNDPVLF